MEVGELVKIRNHAMSKLEGVIYFSGTADRIGLVIATMEMEDGFSEYEVQFEHGSEWFSDLELEVLQ
ncbi:MAG TPA: hypothetical protein EYQ00_09435 [Dehalococcoidia bacterium]|jgi:hypothetical protein|nr:hypothetical protein [Dehalococcoidia bacterium]